MVDKLTRLMPTENGEEAGETGAMPMKAPCTAEHGAQVAVGQNRFGIPFWGSAPPILEPIFVGIEMFTGGTGF